MFIGFAALLSAQRSQFIPEHDFRFGVGCKPFEASKITFGMEDLFCDESTIFDTKDYYSGARYTTNSFFFEYIYQVNSWFGVGASATYLAYFNNYYNGVTDKYVGYNLKQHISLYPTVRLTWLRRRNFNMYSAFGIGQRLVLEHDMTDIHDNNSGQFKIGGQFTLLGFTIGQRIYGFTDLLTLGSQGMLNVGLGYRLSVPQKKK
jgi:hypothetical protein